jgi:hypothetical protein
MSFPLYNTLSKNLSQRDLTKAQKSELISQISQTDKDGHELLYALIKSYYNDHDTLDRQKDGKDTKDKVNEAVSPCTNNNILPYSGEIGKDKMSFNLENFPKPLRQLLYKFLNLHQKKLKEDKQIMHLQA